jgi:hypothetical protein
MMAILSGFPGLRACFKNTSVGPAAGRGIRVLAILIRKLALQTKDRTR